MCDTLEGLLAEAGFKRGQWQGFTFIESVAAPALKDIRQLTGMMIAAEAQSVEAKLHQAVLEKLMVAGRILPGEALCVIPTEGGFVRYEMPGGLKSEAELACAEENFAAAESLI